jgi:uncharacterized membrane protein
MEALNGSAIKGTALTCYIALTGYTALDIKKCNTYKAILMLYLINPLNAELYLIRHLLALAGAGHFVDVSRVRVNITLNT